MKPVKRYHLLVISAAAILLSGCQPTIRSSSVDVIEEIHNDMKTIDEAIQKYKDDHGSLPDADTWNARAALFKEGYIKEYPIPPASIFAREPMDYRFDTRYDNMDAGSARDAVIAVWGLKDEVCREYNHRYSSDNSGPTIYDWEGNGKKYPGETIGRQMTTYAIKWKSDAVDDCEIEWVVEYR